MAKLFIPEIGFTLTLNKDWAFTLHYEYRNRELWEALGHQMPSRYDLRFTATEPCVLPKNTVLKLDRIYIRKGKEDFSSLSWYIEDTPLTLAAPVVGKRGFKQGKKRFWAKLDDCNGIEYV